MSAAPSGLAGFRDGPLGIYPSHAAKRSQWITEFARDYYDLEVWATVVFDKERGDRKIDLQ
jgi:hypothetical protein